MIEQADLVFQLPRGHAWLYDARAKSGPQSRLRAAGAVVLGISPDPVARVQRFHEKYSLGFPLLADEDHAAWPRVAACA